MLAVNKLYNAINKQKNVCADTAFFVAADFKEFCVIKKPDAQRSPTHLLKC